MIADIKNPLLRKSLVVFTIAGTILICAPVWLWEACRDRLERDYGEDIRASWRGR